MRIPLFFLFSRGRTPVQSPASCRFLPSRLHELNRRPVDLRCRYSRRSFRFESFPWLHGRAVNEVYDQPLGIGYKKKKGPLRIPLIFLFSRGRTPVQSPASCRFLPSRLHELNRRPVDLRCMYSRRSFRFESFPWGLVIKRKRDPCGSL